MIDRIKVIIGELAEGYGRLVEINGEADHIHFLVELNPKAAPSVIANNWKTVTSRLLRRDYGDILAKTYRKPVLWSRSYFVASCGGAPLEIMAQGLALKQYALSQGFGEEVLLGNIEQQARPE